MLWSIILCSAMLRFTISPNIYWPFFCAGKTKNAMMNRLSALGVSAHEKELFTDDHQSPEEYANMAREKQNDHDAATFESFERIKNMLVVSPKPKARL